MENKSDYRGTEGHTKIAVFLWYSEKHTLYTWHDFNLQKLNSTSFVPISQMRQWTSSPDWSLRRVESGLPGSKLVPGEDQTLPTSSSKVLYRHVATHRITHKILLITFFAPKIHEFAIPKEQKPWGHWCLWVVEVAPDQDLRGRKTPLSRVKIFSFSFSPASPPQTRCAWAAFVKTLYLKLEEI